MKSLTFDRAEACAAAWQLAQVLWVGGMFMVQVLVAPALGLTGLAPLLMHDLLAQANLLLVKVAALCMLVQVVALLVSGIRRPWADRRALLLLAGLLACGAYGVFAPATSAQVLSYMVLGCCGVLLVLQPLPGAPAVAHR